MKTPSRNICALQKRYVSKCYFYYSLIFQCHIYNSIVQIYILINSCMQTLIKPSCDGSFIMLIALQGDSCYHLVIFIYCIMKVLCHLSFSQFVHQCEHFPIVNNKLLKLIVTLMKGFTCGRLWLLFGCHYVDSLYISNVLLFTDHDTYTYVKCQRHQTTAINNMPQTG